MCASAKALTSSTPHLHTHTRECDKARGSVVELSAGVEIRSCGNGVGGGFAASVGGAGGRVVLGGLEETGGCSTARYGVTTSKKSHHRQTL